MIAGQINVRGEPQATGFDTTFDFERPLVTMPTQVPGGTVTWLPVWSDDAARVTMAGRYHSLSDGLDLSAFQLTSSGVKLEGKGRVDQLSRVANADLTGA